MTNFTSIYGYWEGVQLDPAIANSWGTPNSLNFALIESSIAGVTQVNIAGQTAFTITKSNGASDQWKPAVIQFTGALIAPCTVTVPNVNRGTGQFQNLTTGGFNVIITTGAGTTVTLPPSTTAIYNYFIDASGNVTLPQIISIGTATNDNALTGAVGEYLQATSSVVLGIGVRGDVATLSLSAGDWDVDGIVKFTSFNGGSASSGDLQVWINTVSATIPSTPYPILASTAGFTSNTNIPAFTTRIPAASTTTAYLSAFAGVPGTFTTASMTGLIRARRVR